MFCNALNEVRLLRRRMKAYDHMSLSAHYATPVLIISCFYKSPEPLLITQDLIVYCCRKFIFFSSKNVTNINKI